LDRKPGSGGDGAIRFDTMPSRPSSSPQIEPDVSGLLCAALGQERLEIAASIGDERGRLTVDQGFVRRQATNGLGDARHPVGAIRAARD
jgi:hypothetical protein